MPEVSYTPNVAVFHQAVVTVIPEISSRDGSLVFQMAVDGEPAGQDVIATDFSEGIMKSFRVYPSPYKMGQVFQVSLISGGTISQCEIVTVPMGSYTNTREVGEIQMSYKGNVTLQFYFDGTKLGNDRVFTGTDTFKTDKFYLPSGSRGNVFQYKQVDNADGTNRGYITFMSTDVIAPDTEEPSVPQV